MRYNLIAVSIDADDSSFYICIEIKDLARF